MNTMHVITLYTQDINTFNGWVHLITGISIATYTRGVSKHRMFISILAYILAASSIYSGVEYLIYRNPDINVPLSALIVNTVFCCLVLNCKGNIAKIFRGTLYEYK